MKALSVKGVLETEIHPALPRVTVTGNIDARVLVKKLAKIGKPAEILPEETQKQQKEESNSDTRDKKAEMASEKEKASDIEKAKESNGTETSNFCCKDSNKKDEKGEVKSIDSKDPFLPAELAKSLFPPIVTAVPQMNCAVAPSMVQNSAYLMASHAGVSYPVEPVAVLMPYYTMNAYSSPQPYCIRDHYYFEPPVHHSPPVQSQAMGFADYFNEDNTAGCNIM
ncbi:hypothetical protein COCNU_contig68886640G000010 [Cocos nucifera]|nr:hypothetical protein [Cocos nucifera]